MADKKMSIQGESPHVHEESELSVPSDEQWFVISEKINTQLRDLLINELNGPHAKELINELVSNIRVEMFVLPGTELDLNSGLHTPLSDIQRTLSKNFRMLLEEINLQPANAHVGYFSVHPLASMATVRQSYSCSLHCSRNKHIGGYSCSPC